MTLLSEISHLIQYEIGDVMDEILTELVTPISEFKKNPNLALRNAKGKPFAVLTNNKPSFYVLTPELYDEMLEELWELRSAPEILSRLQSGEAAIEVDIDDLA